MLYVPLDFKNALKIDSEAYVSTIAQTELERIQQKAPTNIFKTDYPSNFQIQVKNDPLEKQLGIATPIFVIGDHPFAEQFVVMNNLIGPFIGLHFMRHISMVIDTTHNLMFFPHLTRQIKSATGETNAVPQSVFTDDSFAILPKITKTVRAFVDYSPPWNTTRIETP